MSSLDALHAALHALVEPLTGRPLGALEVLADVDPNRITLALPPGYPERVALEAAVRAAAQAAGANPTVVVEEGWGSRTVGATDPVPGVSNVILVMSGKGGVGKSTVAANLTLALAAQGARVGLLDADIYGPSMPTMFGVQGPPMGRGGRIEPLERFGVRLMSMGFLLEDAKTAVVWRGPMLHGALLQMLRDVDWGTLDFLLLDMPPGTGDIALTLSQNLPSTGSVIVTTPQRVALQDVYKSVSMNEKVGIPVLGVVENQSTFVCDGCGKRHDLFGTGGGAEIAELAAAPLLGSIPVEAAIRQWGDAGTPIVKAAPESETARAFGRIASALAVQALSQHAAASPLVVDRSGGVQRHLPISR